MKELVLDEMQNAFLTFHQINADEHVYKIVKIWDDHLEAHDPLTWAHVNQENDLGRGFWSILYT